MKIDAHHHFWQYNEIEYGWIGGSLASLRRNFMPTDLESQIKAVGIDGVVSVQARQTLQETEWLLSLAEEHEFIKGVVGWVPLIDPGVRGHLVKLAGHKKLKAIRHVVQDEPDDRFILRDDFNAGVTAATELGLIYDILVFERHLTNTIQFVDRHPDQIFVLDHIGKPRINEGFIDDWADNLCDLARRPNVYCKISGMVTEADTTAWTVEQLRPYWDVVLAAFGPARIIFGSDWPVCTLACDYGQWYEAVSRLGEDLSSEDRANMFGLTACKVYRLNE